MSQEQNNKPPAKNLQDWQFPRNERSEDLTDPFVSSLRETRHRVSASEAQPSPLTANSHGPSLDGGLLTAEWPPRRNLDIETNLLDPRLRAQSAVAAGPAPNTSVSVPARGTSAITAPGSDVKRHNHDRPAAFTNPTQTAPRPSPNPRFTHPYGRVEFPLQPTDEEWHGLARFWEQNPGQAPRGWEPTRLRGAPDVGVIRRERRFTRAEPYPTGSAAREAAATRRTHTVTTSRSMPATPSALYLLPSSAHLLPSTVPARRIVPPINNPQITAEQSRLQLQQIVAWEEARRKRAEDLPNRKVHACPVDSCGKKYVKRRDLRCHVVMKHPEAEHLLEELFS